ncbi:MAG: folate family ECF transporter S component [Butyrivibrio sp.]|jgi:ECF transporter S component (folate family)|uniref:folate family ECF transporter S component n=1 Tax=Butyrivibrio sp. TaxID=28121 RepID=UPI001ED17E69|nr:folate family ECF transporter S component [Butyrivibrio sp.]MBE5842437.1 folate family ECF transporter S component [Butyrivibrio sp.]
MNEFLESSTNSKLLCKERLSPKTMNQLTDTRVMVFCGVMGAIAVVLSSVATIKIGDFLRIGFSSIPNQIVAFLFGPWIGMIFGGAMDIVKFMVHPDGQFNFLFTLVPMVSGLIYGFFLYKRPIKIWNIFLAELLVKIICNLGMNTFFIMLTTGNAFKAIMLPRILTNAGKLPCDVAIMLILLPIINKIIRPEFESSRKPHGNVVCKPKEN